MQEIPELFGSGPGISMQGLGKEEKECRTHTHTGDQDDLGKKRETRPHRAAGAGKEEKGRLDRDRGDSGVDRTGVRDGIYRIDDILYLGDGVVLMRKKLKEARQRAGMTQQQMADKLDITLVYYQKIEQGTRTGDFTLWDTLEDITGVHQRILREISDNRHDIESSP